MRLEWGFVVAKKEDFCSHEATKMLRQAVKLFCQTKVGMD